MQWFKKLFKKSLNTQLNEAAHEFKDLDANDIGSATSTASTHPVTHSWSQNAHNVHIPMGAVPGIMGAHVHTPPSQNPVYAGVGIPNNFNIQKRDRSVTSYRAREYVDKLNLKIASLIRIRLVAKTQEEKDALTLSIDILEMSRELVTEVFVNQLKD